ncbi:hypothetical protein FQA45_01645 [Glutamicibacter halophytocola]|uniref:Uncharacterized protein n=1 Tax=Glutamicibacter halophytocola TaxID=1933880 RepID=A0ABX5Y4S7_9MICC|nr:hypothetical protein [Glutamicibacter halophytocola]QDY65113.1 hypothetical protein FQA45_01645 [Glutamicibacter halophytocola]
MSEVPNGFKLGSCAGLLIGGRFVHAQRNLVAIATAAATTNILLTLALVTGSAWSIAALVILLGLFGLSANSVLMHLAVDFACRAANYLDSQLLETQHLQRQQPLFG